MLSRANEGDVNENKRSETRLEDGKSNQGGREFRHFLGMVFASNIIEAINSLKVLEAQFGDNLLPAFSS